MTALRGTGSRVPDAPGSERGQVVVIFAISIFVFVGLCAIALDLSWYWANTLRMQRAADAAALAGVVHLPGDPTAAAAIARAEAAKNGYVDGVAGVTISAVQDPSNPRRLKVHLVSPVGTFFSRVFGMDAFPAQRDARSEFVLPVPMGSPDAWYGVFGKLRHPGGGITTTTSTAATSSLFPSTAVPTMNWTTPGNADATPNTNYAVSSTSDGSNQRWSTFGLTGTGGVPSSATSIDGIEVLTSSLLTGSGTTITSCRLLAHLSWDNGATWTSSQTSGALSTSKTSQTFGGPTTKWGRTWTRAELGNGTFQVRLTWSRGTQCDPNRNISVDTLQVRVSYHYPVSTFTPDANVAGPAGQTLTPQGFWGVMHGSGAEDINGDKYSPRYSTRTSGANADHDAENYYNYAVEVPAGASGHVYVFDPVMCAVQSDMGTGDRWFGGNTEVWSFFDLYDSRNTLYDLDDDGTPVSSSGSLFKTLNPLTDPSMGGPAISGTLQDCTSSAGSTGSNAGGAYHDQWWQMPGTITGGPSGSVFRLHTTTTDASNKDGNLGANGQNSFALYTDIPGARIYGLGAMEQYSPLPGGGASIFYLAQIESVHAGKTMEIKLWDVGDTNSLPASLKILQPTATGWAPANLSWSAARGTSNANAYACDSLSGSGTTITATASGTQYFQGCWLTIDIPLPSDYAAYQSGWWKIEYDVGGTSGSAFDLTTWQVEIKGNPVHLVLP